MVNNHGDRKFPKDRVMGPLPNGRFMAYKWGYTPGSTDIAAWKLDPD